MPKSVFCFLQIPGFLSGLGGCLAVGVVAVAPWREVKLSRLEVFVEGDIGNSAAWGAGRAVDQAYPSRFRALTDRVGLRVSSRRVLPVSAPQRSRSDT